MKPIIGVIPSYEGGSWKDYYKLYGNYSRCISSRGGIPLIIPAVQKEDMETVLSHLNGLLLTGGYDIAPKYFDEEINANNVMISKERDEYELALAKKALDMDLPILGICRGIQVLNVIAGGTLYQDVNQDGATELNHSVLGDVEEKYGVHNVIINEGSILHCIFNQRSIKVNSIHHQAVKAVSPDFIISALSEDGIIEGIESKSHSFVLGVQWHPERMAGTCPEQYGIFDELIKEALKYNK